MGTSENETRWRCPFSLKGRRDSTREDSRRTAKLTRPRQKKLFLPRALAALWRSSVGRSVTDLPYPPVVRKHWAALTRGGA